MNRFSRTHPLVLFLYFCAVVSVAMFVKNPVYQLISLAGGGVYATYLSRGRNFLSETAFYAVLFALIALTNPIFSHKGETELFFLNDNPVTLEAVIYGVFTATAIIGVILWFLCITKIFTSEKFLFLFGKISPKLAILFSMTLAFIPRFKLQFSKNLKAHKALGIFSAESRTDRLKLSLRTFLSTVSQSAENSVELSDSMRARGYGSKKRTTAHEYKLRKSDLAVGVIVALTVMFQIFAGLDGSTDFKIYPTFSLARPDLTGAAAYIMYALLCFLPTIIEITESLKWKYFVSKI